MKTVNIWTDGACCGNPGPGGWCAILQYGKHEKIISGAIEKSTNNRMELTAIIKGIEALKVRCRVNIYTDSGYVVDAINESYLEKWGGNGWKTKKGTLVKNIDLWKKLRELLGTQVITFNWISSKGLYLNNIRADEIAKRESRKYQIKKSKDIATSGNYVYSRV